jgi:hypothetical protein
MEITYQLTTNDFHRTLKAYRAQHWSTRWVFRFGVGFVIAVFVFGLAALIVAPGRVPPQSLMPIFVLGAMWLVLLWVTPYFWARSQLRGSPSAKSAVTMDISESGVHMRSQYVDSNMAWPTFVRCVEEERVFALFMSPKSAIPIPKRAFAPNQLEEFRELIRRKLTLG